MLKTFVIIFNILALQRKQKINMENNQYFRITSLLELDICINHFGSKWNSPNRKVDRGLFSGSYRNIVKNNGVYHIQSDKLVKQYKLKEVPKPAFLFQKKSDDLLSRFRTGRLLRNLKNLDAIEKSFYIEQDKELQEEITKCERSLFECCSQLGMKVKITYEIESSTNK